MNNDTEELERPGEWLLRFQEDCTRYRDLVGGMGLAQAAYRVARARCLSAPLASRVPTSRELRAAACDVARHTGLAIPAIGHLYEACRSAGLLVIAERRAV